MTLSSLPSGANTNSLRGIPRRAQRAREEIQEPFIRGIEIDPALYYPEGYMPFLLPQWPVEGDLVVPLDQAPDDLVEGMDEAWRKREENRRILRQRQNQ